MQHIKIFAVQDILQVLTVLILLHHFINAQNVFPADPSIQIGDFLQTGDFAVLMLLTFFLSLALDAAGLLPFSPIGILMPGIIAREFDRQGFRDSLLAMAVTTGLTALALLLVGGALAGL